MDALQTSIGEKHVSFIFCDPSSVKQFDVSPSRQHTRSFIFSANTLSTSYLIINPVVRCVPPVSLPSKSPG